MKHQHKVFFLCFSLLLVLPGCWKPLRKLPVHIDNKHHLWGALEAKWYDVPLPVQVQKAQRIDLVEVDNGGYILRYRVNIDLDDAQRFYFSEMETHGWRMYDQFSADNDMLFIFEKPTKRCVISLKRDYGQTILSIYHREFVDHFKEMVWEE